MKSFSKIFLILSSVLMVLGLVLVITGGLMGGANVVAKDLENGKLSLTWVPGIFEDDIDMKNMKSISNEMQFSKEEVSQLEFQGKYGEYEISTWDRAYYAIEGVQNNEKAGYSFEEGVLKVAVGNGGHWIWNRSGTKIKIYVPQDAVLNKTVLKVGAGTLLCNDLKTKKLEAKIGAGEATFQGIEAEEAGFEVGAGEGTVTNTKIQECKIEVGMGEIDLEGSVDGNVDIDCGMGEVECNLVNRYESFNYQVKVGAGEVSIGGEEYSGLSKHAEINNSAEKTMNIDCGMGEVSVKFGE